MTDQEAATFAAQILRDIGKAFICPKEKGEPYLEAADRIEALSAQLAQAQGERDELRRGLHALVAALDLPETTAPPQKQIERLSVIYAGTVADASALRRENEYLTSAGIIEVAVRNQSVSDYIDHWEGRTLKAEADAQAQRERAERFKAAIVAALGSPAMMGAEDIEVLGNALDADRRAALAADAPAEKETPK